MRLPRTSLLGRLTGPDAPPVVLLEAPAGYGKSWLARRAAGPDVLRLRGGARRRSGAEWGDETVLLDDAHLLCPVELARVAERIEDARRRAPA